METKKKKSLLVLSLAPILYDGTSTTNLTNNATLDGLPKINNSGYVVWERDGEMWLYDRLGLSNNEKVGYEATMNASVFHLASMLILFAFAGILT